MGEFTVVEGGTTYEDEGRAYMAGYYFDEKREESFFLLYNRGLGKIVPGKRMRNLYSPGELEHINEFVGRAVENILHNFQSIHNWTEENSYSES